VSKQPVLPGMSRLPHRAAHSRARPSEPWMERSYPRRRHAAVVVSKVCNATLCSPLLTPLLRLLHSARQGHLQSSARSESSQSSEERRLCRVGTSRRVVRLYGLPASYQSNRWRLRGTLWHRCLQRTGYELGDLLVPPLRARQSQLRRERQRQRVHRWVRHCGYDRRSRHGPGVAQLAARSLVSGLCTSRIYDLRPTSSARTSHTAVLVRAMKVRLRGSLFRR
jgi:hypothetical protein